MGLIAWFKNRTPIPWNKLLNYFRVNRKNRSYSQILRLIAKNLTYLLIDPVPACKTTLTWTIPSATSIPSLRLNHSKLMMNPLWRLKSNCIIMSCNLWWFIVVAIVAIRGIRNVVEHEFAAFFREFFFGHGWGFGATLADVLLDVG